MGSEPRVAETMPGRPGGTGVAEPSGAFRRLLLLLLVTALLAFCFMLVRTVTGELADWRTLPNNSRVRIFSASYGTKHPIRFPCNTWGRHYSEVVVNRGWRGVLHGSLWIREQGGTGWSSKEPCTLIYFHVGDHPGVLSFVAEVDGDNGEVIHAAGRSGSTAATTYFIAGLKFDQFPRKRAKVQLRARLDGVPHTFEISNPAYAP